jgi:hypothetical protein
MGKEKNSEKQWNSYYAFRRYVLVAFAVTFVVPFVVMFVVPFVVTFVVTLYLRYAAARKDRLRVGRT